MLSCIAAVAIVSGYGGIKAYQPYAKDCENMLLQNVEALAASGEDDDEKKYHDKDVYTVGTEESIHFIKVSETEERMCYDVTTVSVEYCQNEGGVLTCSPFLKKNVKHNPLS